MIYNTPMAPVEQPGDITVLLQRWREGNKQAENELFDLVIPHLHSLAHNRLIKERRGHSLDTIALVNEAYQGLLKANESVDWRSRSHFFAISARIMRRYLIDEWRRCPKADFLPLDSAPIGRKRDLDTEIEVERLLDELAQKSRQWCEVVELKHYLGLTDREIADVMELSLRSVQRMWKDARIWLFERLEKKSVQESAR
jgi:RNA polymerase sigma factor (TIGR02999 family)